MQAQAGRPLRPIIYELLFQYRGHDNVVSSHQTTKRRGATDEHDSHQDVRS